MHADFLQENNLSPPSHGEMHGLRSVRIQNCQKRLSVICSFGGQFVIQFPPFCSQKPLLRPIQATDLGLTWS